MYNNLHRTDARNPSEESRDMTDVTDHDSLAARLRLLCVRVAGAGVVWSLVCACPLLVSCASCWADA